VCLASKWRQRIVQLRYSPSFCFKYEVQLDDYCFSSVSLYKFCVQIECRNYCQPCKMGVTVLHNIPKQTRYITSPQKFIFSVRFPMEIQNRKPENPTKTLGKLHIYSLYQLTNALNKIQIIKYNSWQVSNCHMFRHQNVFLREIVVQRNTSPTCQTRDWSPSLVSLKY
jgi:hypothetical protein